MTRPSRVIRPAVSGVATTVPVTVITPPVAIARFTAANSPVLSARSGALLTGHTSRSSRRLSMIGTSRGAGPYNSVFRAGSAMTSSEQTPRVGVVMGSRSDWEIMQHAVQTLLCLGIAHEVRVVSAHRTPDLLFEYADQAVVRGLAVLIA